jgi:NDP-sugar pyrophosphorylase family protein
MIGVIVLSGPFPQMHGLDSQRSPSLLPLGDRPALQHIVESLVTQGITCIDLIVGHAPERVEALLGNGDRWGCHFQYHLAAQPDRPYRSLRVIPRIAEESWVLIHAEQFPCVDFCGDPVTRPTLFYGSFKPLSDQGPSTSVPATSEQVWGGTAVLPPTDIDDEFASFTFQELGRHFDRLIGDGGATIATTADWIDVSTPAGLLRSQSHLLDKKLRGLLISGSERKPGIWISRNVTIHPSATLTPPVYVGTNTRVNRGVKLGPYAVIGSDCIIDSNTVIDNSLILEGSYVGEALEVHTAIVAHNLLVNVRLDASVDISEDFLLGRLDRTSANSWIGRSMQSVLAAFLFLLFLPILILATIYFYLLRNLPYQTLRVVKLPADEKGPTNLSTCELPCFGSDAWSVHRGAGWDAFLRQFLPGLTAVIRGQLNFVGLPPRTAIETQALSEDWRAIYFQGKAGLISEAAVSVTDRTDDLQFYLADAYYSVQHSTAYDFKLAARYFGRLLTPKRRSPLEKSA